MEPDKIGQHFSKMVQGETTENQLWFNPETGELELVPKNTTITHRGVDHGKHPTNPDAMVLDQIAEDGFM